ncbi:protein DCL, chloroplastic isoform X2 [Amborella trichopoda]|uniref:Uncharacterized protein n=1 Tax=Amborella trichopoda TaxID=13333 RepID=U5D5J7_AMBTC|nr:protein DCL, chloroplastic isoform X2 [Amborella trichopoda]ERN16702.1 hypothetical protein AMTR_s00051p00224060 [Amborella trichopoda]|eukprot:XP_006855235.1 protein DCL, chloroplastic isoform X2 [Amborella trichopoda]
MARLLLLRTPSVFQLRHTATLLNQPLPPPLPYPNSSDFSVRLRLFHEHLAAASASSSHEDVSSSSASVQGMPNPRSSDHPDYRRWKAKEEEILRDIEPITDFTKEILHSNRYVDGECLTLEDEKVVVEKLLAYHPHSQDKIGCGLDAIMVDRHPQFRNSRCLFVVRTDGGWIDFSYQKCLRAYIRKKYPSYAEKFIREHFKRGS